ncbi:Protein bunched, class 2/F isoform [Penaeus vannamei]|uniref:Protein bunched, class 2/F isoform n=1 Tax=Penaeus vannamei TaxID=6689 RepID=A0A423SDX9_PENVA|nr:Protein bunched, class 2/F isoform [Penaeus vannamei]
MVLIVLHILSNWDHTCSPSPRHVTVTLTPNQYLRRETWMSRQGPASPKTTSLFIETRIEQAMELVKSHLVHAVREEMDCMRDTIVQLKMRVSQLEQENAALRAV